MFDNAVPVDRKKNISGVLIHYLVFIIAFINSLSIYGQERSFTSLNTENGLSSNAILAITQDKKGFLWLATPYGLNRYDGRGFSTYLHSNEPYSISHNYILCLLTDKSGQLWVGTTNGVNKYNEKLDGFDTIFTKFPATGESVEVAALLELSDKKLLWGTTRGLYYVEAGTKMAKPHPLSRLLGNQDIKTIYEDRQQNLWVGTKQGLTRILSYKTKPRPYHFRQTASPGSLPGDFITSITEDHNGRIWIGTHHNGVCRFEESTNSFSPLKGLPANEHIRQIFVDNQNQFWIGTQKGLVVYNPVNGQLIRYIHNIELSNSISQNSVYSIYQDRNSNMWIGTYFGGLNQLSSYKTPFSPVIQQSKAYHDLLNYVASGLAMDNRNNLWAGTEDGGVFKISTHTGHTTRFVNDPNNAKSIGSNNVKTIFKDVDENLWIGTHGGGLNVYDPAKEGFTRFNLTTVAAKSATAEINSILEDEAHHLWVGSNIGLYTFRRTGTQLTPITLPLARVFEKAQVKALFKDSRNRIWVSSTGGIYRFDQKTPPVWLNFYVANSISESGDGSIWFAVNNIGLARYNDTTGQVALALSYQNLANRNIMCLLPGPDPTSLWLSMDKGIGQLNTANMNLRSFTRSDGMPNDNFNTGSGLRLANGQILFGGMKGIVAFNPADINLNTAIAPIYFTGFKLFDSTLGIGTGSGAILKENMVTASHITLAHDQNVFTINYALLNYIRPAKNRYRYILEGYSRGWINTDQPYASFTNVPPGTYLFKVKGANNDGIWGKPIALTLTIDPPFWRSWWAYVFYILLTAAIVFLITRYLFLRAVVKREEALHQNKLNFFTNISHEIRTQLTLLTLPIEQLVEKNKTGLIPHAHEQELILRNTQRLQQLVNELMDFRKAETGNLKLYISHYSLTALLEEVIAHFRNMAQERQITLDVVYDTNSAYLYIDKNQLAKVFFNLIGNALKYIPPGSRITIHLLETAKDVTTTVTDNGPGISSEFLDTIFNNYYQVAEHEQQNTGYGIGLALSKSIVELHKGNISVQSTQAHNENQGATSFTVVLQKGTRHLHTLPYVIMNASPETDITYPLTEEGSSVANPVDMGNVGNHSPYTLLVVEDNIELRMLICNSFKTQFVILEATNGHQGLEIAQQEIPDIIISDVMMPVMDGFELCRQLKTDKRTSHIPVILLTAKNTQTDQIHGLEIGANLYLTKPFSSRILQLNVKNLLQLREQQKELALSRLNQPATPDNSNAESEPAEKLPAIDQEFLDELIQITDDNMDKDGFGVTVLSKKIGMSPPILYKKLFAVTGLTVNEFIKTQKLNKAAALIEQHQLTLQDIAEAVGYKDHKYFMKEFRKHFGVSPKDHKEN